MYRTILFKQIDCPNRHRTNRVFPLIILCKQRKCGFRQIGRALCRNANPALPLLREKLIVADGNRNSACFLFMRSQLSSDFLHQLQHDTPDFGVIFQILHGCYPVPNAFYRGDIIGTHNRRIIQSVGILLNRQSILSKAALQEIIRCCSKLSNGMNPITGQNLLGRSADSKQVRGGKTPNLLPERICFDAGNRIRLFHIRPKLGKNLVETHSCGNRKSQFKLNRSANFICNFKSGSHAAASGHIQPAFVHPIRLDLIGIATVYFTSQL